MMRPLVVFQEVGGAPLSGNGGNSVPQALRSHGQQLPPASPG